MGIREVPERVSERIEKVPGRYVDSTVKASRVAERGRQIAFGSSAVVCVCVCGVVCVHACVCATFCAYVYNLWHLLVPTKKEAQTFGCFLI